MKQRWIVKVPTAISMVLFLALITVLVNGCGGREETQPVDTELEEGLPEEIVQDIREEGILPAVVTPEAEEEKVQPGEEIAVEEETIPGKEAAVEEKKQKEMVAKGDTVKIHYKGRLEDGTVFDNSEGRDPLEFVVGSGQVIPGFDNAVEGMKLNEEKEVTIPSEEAYGARNEALIREFPPDFFPEGFDTKEGLVIRLQDPSGRPALGQITKMEENSVTVDLNHPLAGKDLIFNMKVVGIE